MDSKNYLCDLACWAIKSQENDAKLSKMLIKDFVLFKWTQKDGSDVGVRFWSKKAFDFYKENKGLFTMENGKRKRALRHEHVIPRAFLTPYILKLNPNHVHQFLEFFCFGAILHKDEDKLIPKELKESMPAGWKINLEDVESWKSLNLWKRYEDAFKNNEVEIHEVSSLKKDLTIGRKIDLAVGE